MSANFCFLKRIPEVLLAALVLFGPGNAFAASVSSGDLLVTDIGVSAATTALLSINPTTGVRSIVSRNDTGSGASFNLVADVAVTPSGEIYVTDTGSAAIRSVKKIDPSTGDRTLISGAGAGSGTAFAGAIRGLAWDHVDGTLLVADNGLTATDTALVRVNPTTGDRTILSRNDTGSGSSFNLVNDVLVAPNGDIYVADASGANSSVKKIDRSTGNRTLVSGNGAGSGTAFSSASRTLFWDFATAAILVCDIGTSAATTALYRIVPSTGARVIVSRNDTGSGSAFTAANAGVVGLNATYYVIDSAGVNSNVKLIDSSTGNRTLVSGAGAGSGTAASAEWRGATIYNIQPSVATVIASNVGQANAGQTSYSFTIQYADDLGVDVSSIGTADVTVTGPPGSLTVSSGTEATGVDGTSKTGTYVVTPPGGAWNEADNGTYTISINSAQIADTGNLYVPAGNAGSFTVNLDTTAPSAPSTPDLSAASDSGSSSTDNLTSDNTPTFTGTAEAGSTVRLYANAVQVGSGTATGGAWSITASSLTNATYSITAAATDSAGNTGSSSPGLSVTIDTLPPTVSIGSPSSSITRSGPVTCTVTYADANFASSTLTAGNITLNSTGTANGSVAVSGSGTTRTVAISSVTGNGTLGISIASATATDTAGNTAPAAGPSQTFTADNAAPPAPSITGITSDTGSSASDGITIDNTLILSGTAEAGSTVSVTRAGTGVIGTTAANGGGAWSFDYTGTSLSEGSYTFTATATDVAGNASSASVAFAVTVDATAPTISIGSPSASVTSSAPVTYTVTYADANFASSTLTTGNITLNRTGTANGSVAVSGSGTTRTITISSISGDGTLGLSIASGTATDAAGNGAPSAGPSTTFVVDNANDAPSITGTEADQTVDDNATLAPFANTTIVDADQPAQTLAVSVTLDAAAKGSFSTLNGFSDDGGGVYTFSGTAAAATTAIRGLIFDPANNRVAVGSTETTTCTISVNDGIASAVTDNTTTVIATSVNDDPVAGANSITRRTGASAKISTAELVANDTDADGHSLTLTLPSATSVNGASVAIQGRWVVYSSPVSDNPDSFIYLVNDGHGGSAAGIVTVTVQDDTAQSKNILGIVADGLDQVIRFAGIPGRSYMIQYATDLGNPTWTGLGVVAAGTDGLFEYRDVNPPGPSRFYRSFLP